MATRAASLSQPLAVPAKQNLNGFRGYADTQRLDFASMLGDARDVAAVRTERFDAVGRLPLVTWNASGDGRALVAAELERAVTRFEAEGPRSFLKVAGPFALMLWDRHHRVLWVARDPMGIAALYVEPQQTGLTVSTDLDAFAETHDFDTGFIANFIASRGNPDGLGTIRRGVSAVAPGGWLRWEDGRVSTDNFWTYHATPRHCLSLTDAGERYRELAEESVRAMLSPNGGTWAHLSGGLDSSWVSSIAGAIGMQQGAASLGGTVTTTDTLGNADETEFVSAVVDRYRLRNEQFPDVWPWQHHSDGPPVTERPSRDYPYYSRDRSVASTIRGAGGHAVMSGIGPDLYLPHSTTQCNDHLWSGNWRSALSELHGHTVRTRGTFLKVAVRDGVLPLITGRRRAAALQRNVELHRWFTDAFMKASPGLQNLTQAQPAAGRRGHYYDAYVQDSLQSFSERVSQWQFSPGVEIRHPLMHLPLVEFVLRLAPELRSRVRRSKLVLREAAKGVLPDVVRNRAGGGIIAPRIFWALRHERPVLKHLLQQSVLADLGCIEPKHILRSLDSFDIYKTGEATFLYVLLSLETWLTVKTGRWTESYQQRTKLREDTA